jgi:hypothetical protein
MAAHMLVGKDALAGLGEAWYNDAVPTDEGSLAAPIGPRHRLVV